MAENRRTAAKRLVVVAALALLLWLLFELNRFLPGAWPGGGGTAGSRTVSKGSGADAARVVSPRETPPARPTAPPHGILVLVSGANGKPIQGAAVTLEGGASARDADGHGAVFAEASPADAFRVAREDGGGVVRHGPPPAGTRRLWQVAWPSASTPDVARPSTGGARLRVLDEAGTPIAKARVEVRFRGGSEASIETDADGVARIPEDRGDSYRACVSAPGTGEACAHGSLSRPGPLDLRLPRLLPLVTRFVDPATGKALAAKAVRLAWADGRTTLLERAGPPAEGFDAPMPADAAASTSLEVEVADRPIVRVPLPALAAETPVPAGSALVLSVSGPDRRPRPKARVEVRYPPTTRAEAGESGPVVAVYETGEDGRLRVPLPTDRAADVLVLADDAAPRGIHVGAGPAGGPVAVALERGTRLRVRVVDESGAPVPGAEVVVLSRAGNSEARRTAVTDAQGVAVTAPVAAGVAEVHAHRAGYAWGSAGAEAPGNSTEVRVTLRRGHSLHLVVDDPWGVPLPGVSVRSVPYDPGEGSTGLGPQRRGPPLPPPDERPWATDADGVLLVPDLEDRPLLLVLSKPGYADERVPLVFPDDAETWFATLVPAAAPPK